MLHLNRLHRNKFTKNKNLFIMLREIIKIDEEKCDGCGLCVPNCHEGALQIIDGKARLVSDLLCDGLGACIGHCPKGAITIEKRESEPYNEKKVMKIIVDKGKNTVIAHLKHLLDNNEQEYFKEALDYLYSNKDVLDFNIQEILDNVFLEEENVELNTCGCPGSSIKEINRSSDFESKNHIDEFSELSQWPIQLHLVNPAAPYFKNCDLIVAADCTAYAYGNFHVKFLKGKKLVIACPKLDEGIDIYVDKIRQLIDVAIINTITVVIMEVPCCSGLYQIVRKAIEKSNRKVPIKLIIIGIEGEILKEE